MPDLAPIADEWWGRPCLAYHVQPNLAPETGRQLWQLQQRVAEIWPQPLFLAPPEAMHVTIYPLAMVQDSYDKDSYWRMVAPLAQAILADLCPDVPRLTLTYVRLKVTNVAIIAVARDDTGLIDAIRRRIVDTVPTPPVRGPLHYDLIHTTLARYRSAEPVAASVVERVERLPVAIAAEVTGINLVRETRFACLSRDVLASVPVGAGTT